MHSCEKAYLHIFRLLKKVSLEIWSAPSDRVTTVCLISAMLDTQNFPIMSLNSDKRQSVVIPVLGWYPRMLSLWSAQYIGVSAAQAEGVGKKYRKKLAGFLCYACKLLKKINNKHDSGGVRNLSLQKCLIIHYLHPWITADPSPIYQAFPAILGIPL